MVFVLYVYSLNFHMHIVIPPLGSSLQAGQGFEVEKVLKMIEDRVWSPAVRITNMCKLLNCLMFIMQLWDQLV